MRLLGEHRDVGFVTLPPAAPDTAEVTAAQIDAWYQAHKSDYRKPETVRLEYVEIDGSAMPAPAADEAALRKRYQEQIAKYSSAEKREVAAHPGGGRRRMPATQTGRPRRPRPGSWLPRRRRRARTSPRWRVPIRTTPAPRPAAAASA